jgi:hypothetical protein
MSLHLRVHVGSLISAFADQLSSKGYRMTNGIQNEAEHEHDELLDDEDFEDESSEVEGQ